MSEKEQKQIGERLREAREYLRLSQEEVANYLKISRSAVSLMESGQRGVGAIELKSLAKLYQTSVSRLTGETSGADVSPDVEFLKRATTGLTQKDRDEVIRFAQFLKARSEREKDDDSR